MEDLAARVILLWGWRRALAAFVAGALAVLTQAPYDFFPAGFVSFTLLVWLLDGATTERGDGALRRARAWFSVGWWFGLGYFLAGLWWVGQALLVDAENFAWALPFAILGLPALLALFYGVATTVARLMWSDGIGRVAAMAFGFGLAEWLRATILTGFPWNAIGYAAMPMPLLMQSVSVVGLFAMNALAVFVFAMPALLASDRHRRAGLALGVVLVAAHVGFGALRIAEARPEDGTRDLRVRVVQPSVPQDGKWEPAYRDSIAAKLLDLSRRAPRDGAVTPELIVWPETALPYLLTDRPDALAAIGEMLQAGQRLLLGAVRSEGGAEAARYYNSVIAINDAGEIADAVDKVRLVPFGEFLPFQDVAEHLGFRTIAETIGGFSAGAARHALTVSEGIRALPMICYEIIFPGEAERAEGGADLIVNVTNDAWFGDTPGPYQHFRQAQVRAVEAGMPLVRAANNGISAVVDEKGRILDAFAIDAVGVIDATVRVGAARPPALGSPPLNSLLILLFFATLACGMKLLQRIRSK